MGDGYQSLEEPGPIGSNQFGSDVMLAHPAGSSAGHAHSCVGSHGTAAAPGLALGERRRASRFPADEPATLTQITPHASGRNSIRIGEVSKGGLRIHLSSFLYPGTIVQIFLQHVIATAEVRHCAQNGDEFCAGVAVLEIFPRRGHAEGATF
jgi:hypothetical protein